MKSYSLGLEVFVLLSKKEFSDLEKEVLEGEIKFRGIGAFSEKQRDIPFELKYSAKQKHLLEVELDPENIYFGDVDSVEFSINRAFYDEIKRFGKYGSRFFTSGRLTIETV